MRLEKQNKFQAFLFALIIFNIMLGYGKLWAGNPFFEKQKETKPILYMLKHNKEDVNNFIANPNSIDSITAANNTNTKFNLVIATHGWIERKPWPREMVIDMRDNTKAKDWLFGWYDWRKQAIKINPTDAARFGRDTAGPLLGQKIIKLSKDFKHIHLIGHSAGSWVISEAAKVISKETDATIHLTFLDTYVPPSWKEDELADFSDEPNTIYWADHYFTCDITLKTTERELSNAHNINLTDVDPGINDHELPRYWYHATVISKYVKGQRYEGKQLFYETENLKYGFPRSLESGIRNWQTSMKLRCGNKALKINKDKKTTISKLQQLFQKKKK
ncbi:MAG: lipase family protein [Planctomycetota bacterium]|jgi:hypothetical protein